MKKYNLMGIVIENRRDFAPLVQEILTSFGCIIKTRIGLHEGTEEECSNEGFIILTLKNDEEEIKKLISELKNIEGVRVKNVEI